MEMQNNKILNKHDAFNEHKLNQDPKTFDSSFLNPEQTMASNSGLCNEDPFSLIDLSDSASLNGGWNLSTIQPQHLENEIVTHAFKIPNSNMDTLNLADLNSECKNIYENETSKNVTVVQSSLIPSRNKTSQHRGNRHSKNACHKQGNLPHNLSSTPESIVSEIDPYTQWYQMMQQYYKQYYPNYDFKMSGGRATGWDGQQKERQPQFVQQPLKLSVSGATAPSRSMPQGVENHYGVRNQQANAAGQMDYAAYYYEYYFGAAQAWQAKQVDVGRITPKIFIEPHIRAHLTNPGFIIQILPNRPHEGEPGRVELLDISQLVTDVVAEATSLLAESTTGGGAGDGMLMHHSSSFSVSQSQNHDAIFTQGSSEHSSGGGCSRSLNMEDDEEEERQKYAAILTGWDRTDHVLYPGPLSRGTTLKSDVLAFLRGKVEDIQDRMPVDWDSAGLLIAYLELLVKNNGVVPVGDVVALLLEDDSSRHYDYITPHALPSATNIISPYAVSTIPSRSRQRHQRVPSDTCLQDNLVQSSGQQSPSPLMHSESAGQFFQSGGQYRGSSASSNGGAASLNRFLLRKSGVGTTTEERDANNLNRFRELLMHGHPLKALEHACQIQLWGHAFALAQRMGSAVLTKVMEKFMGKSIHPSDPLLTFYQLTANEMPQSVNQLAYSVGADNGDWRPHLAMLLSAPEANCQLAKVALERMGESLLARRLLYAAQFCFLLASAQAQFPPQIWLLGATRPNTVDETDEYSKAHNEAIQLTEIYEYTQSLAVRDKHFFLPQFLTFKLSYCLRLIDAGLIEKAFRYLEVLSHGLVETYQNSDHNPHLSTTLFTMVSQCLRFAERLQFHPDIGSFESTTGASHEPHHQPQWIYRLREVYSCLCEGAGLPTEQLPFVDPSMPKPLDECHPVSNCPEYDTSVPPSNESSGQQSVSQMSTQDNSHYNLHQQSQYAQGPNIQPHHPPLIQIQPQPNQVLNRDQSVDSQPPSVRYAKSQQPLASSSSRQQAFNNQQEHIQPLHYHQKPDWDIMQNSQVQENQEQPMHPQQHQAPGLLRKLSVLAENQHVIVNQPLPVPSTPKQAATSFFMPISGGESEVAVPSSYDYFSGVAAQAPSRSRTISMNSQDDDSSHQHTVDQNVMAVSSATTPTSHPPRQHTPSGTFRSRNVSSTSTLGESRLDLQTETARANNSQSTSPQMIAQEPSSGQEENDHTSIKPYPKSLSKGWLSGIINRIKPTGKEIILPDDSEPTMIWDTEKKRWLDVKDPQPEEVLPPPPQMSTPLMAPGGAPTSLAPIMPLMDDTARLSTLGGIGHNRCHGGRPRYVNVLANQTSGSAAQKVGGSNLLTPPFPPSLMSSTSPSGT